MSNIRKEKSQPGYTREIDTTEREDALCVKRYTRRVSTTLW